MNMDDFAVKPIPYQETKSWLLYKHYAHRMPPITYAFGLFKDGFMVGCCTYGRPFSTTLQLCLGKENQERLFELNRLVVNDGMERNVLSYFVSQTFKLLPKPIALVSYADSGQGHHGYIYQATNWLYTGMSAPFKDYVVRGMGSGTTAIACIKEKRHFIGFELSKEYFDKAVQRIKNEQMILYLF